MCQYDFTLSALNRHLDTAGACKGPDGPPPSDKERGLGGAASAGGKSFGGRMTSQAQAASALPGVRGLAFLGFPLHAAGQPSDERAKHLFDVRVPMLFLQGATDKLADPALLALIAERVEGNLVAAAQELRKLALLFPAGPLPTDAVRAAVLDVARYDVFDTIDAALDGVEEALG